MLKLKFDKQGSRLIFYTQLKLLYICIGKNPSLTLARDKTKIEYISEEQPSSYELAFEGELGLNSHSKNLRWYLSLRSIHGDKS